MAASTTALVQAALTKAGFDTQGVDGTWGPDTSEAASAYQSAKGLSATGLPEPELLTSLGVPVPVYTNAREIADALNSTLGNVVLPKDALLILLHESGMDPAAVNRENGSPVAAGIFQVLVTELPAVTGMTLAQWTSLSAAQQVPYAAKFWRAMTAEFKAVLPVSARDLYWVNFLPAAYVVGAPDSYVFVWETDMWQPATGGPKEHGTGFYTQNIGLDHPLPGQRVRKGYITAGDMGLAAEDGAKENVNAYAAIASALVTKSA